MTLIPLVKFGGMVTNPAGEDIPDFSSEWNINLDPETQSQLKGVPTSGTDFVVSRTVTDATNATPIVITTSAVHGLSTGATVTIASVGGNTAANGTWVITVITTTTFSLDTSVGSGAYTSGGTSKVHIPDATESRFIKYNASGTMKWDLVCLDKEDNDITVIEDFYNSEANRTFNDLVTSPTGTVSTVEMFGKEAQIGLGNGDDEIPYVVYRLLNDRKFFNDNETASAGVFAHYGRCTVLDSAGFLVSDASQTNPLVITTTLNHQLISGDVVVITGVTVASGSTSANGIFTITVTDDNKFSLNGVDGTGDGVYASGGTVGVFTVFVSSSTLSISDTSGDYFQAGIMYAWGISLVYDGLQESNLMTTALGVVNKALDATRTSDSATITLQALAANSRFANDLYWDKRVTAVKIYRAESSDNSVGNLGLYRLVQTIDINKGHGSINWTVSGSNYNFAYIDNGGYPEGGQTYEEETGISETVSRTYIHYGLNTTGGGYHWMAQPYVPTPSTGGAPTPIDWDRYIFRSMRYRPNMVNWAEGNHLVLPEIPVELKFYNNKLYAFSENRTYRVNPELLIIEDDFEGAGVSAQGGVIATEYGMFFCNLNGAYWIKGNELITISDNIEVSLGNYSVNWLQFASDSLTRAIPYLDRIIVSYLSDKRCVVFMGNEGTSTTYAFVYYLPTREWFTWDFGSQTLDSNSGVVTGKDGEIYMSGDTTMNKLLGGSSFEDCEWVSKEFTLNKTSQDKLWKKIKWDEVSGGIGAVTVKYNTEGADPIGGTTATNDAYINIYKKTMQIYAKVTGSKKLDSLDILTRELRGTR